MPIPLITLNLLLFAGLGWYDLAMAARSGSDGLRLLWRLAALPAFAVVVGGVQRFALQAARAGWLPDGAQEILLVEWQIGQSMLVAGVALVMLLGIRRLGRRFNELESVAGAMLDRLALVDVTSITLTSREREVLELIGGSALVDDKTLAEKLGVSSATVHTHVTALLRKTKLTDRRDLAVLAYLLRKPPPEPSHLSR